MNEIETTHVYEYLRENYLKSKSKVLFALEGSSGAAKTWGGIDFILDYCRMNSFEEKRITIGRETYRDCIDTVAFDFFKRLKQIGWYDEKAHKHSHPQSYILFGNLIEFTGWSTNGQPSKRQDILWFNEILESNEEDFKQYNQRTNEVVIFDWNPKVTEHWVYDKLLNRPDCFYKHCLMLDNPFLPEGQREELKRYEPTKENIENGTADDYMYNVYTLGIRTAATGVIFKYVTWIDKFPDVGYWYGLDFGFTTDPSALVKVAIQGKNLFLELLCYEPIETPETLDEFFKVKGIEKFKPIIADSSDKYTGENKGTIEMVRDLKAKGWKISKVNKTQSVVFWIGKMKEYKIHLVKSEESFLYRSVKKEQENYKWRTINGIEINQPLDKFNHFWDASRYAVMAVNKKPYI